MTKKSFKIEAHELLIHKWGIEAENEEAALDEALKGCPLPDGDCESNDFMLVSMNGRPLPAPVSLTFTKEEWTEIAEACRSKASFIERGDFGPEIETGEDKRWIADLERIVDKVETEADL